MDAAGAGRPSGVARDRLAARIRADVADVRVRLEEAVLRSDVLLATGQRERAAAVIDEQHALLAELQDTIASAVAAASVEAEAEAVLLGAPDGSALFAPAGVPAPSDLESPRRSLRATASALASAVAVLAALIVAAPTPAPDVLAANGAGETSGADADDASAPGSTGRSSSDATTTERAIGPNELEVRRLFASPAPATGPRGSADRMELRLSGLQALVDQLVATVVRAAGELTPAAPQLVADEIEVRRARTRAAAEPEPEASGEQGSAEASDAESREDGEGTAEGSPEGSPEPSDEASEPTPVLPLSPDGGTSADASVPPLE